jgi:hypothetical protein
MLSHTGLWGPGPAGDYVIIVRRGNTEAFAVLRRNFDERIVWDRRVAPRRTQSGRVAGERRRGERRRLPPPSWTEHGFLLGDSGGIRDV